MELDGTCGSFARFDLLLGNGLTVKVGDFGGSPQINLVRVHNPGATLTAKVI